MTKPRKSRQQVSRRKSVVPTGSDLVRSVAFRNKVLEEVRSGKSLTVTCRELGVDRSNASRVWTAEFPAFLEELRPHLQPGGRRQDPALVFDAVVDAVRQGSHPLDAFAAHGVTRGIAERFLGSNPDARDAIVEAVADVRVLAVKTVRKAMAGGDWQAAKWWLSTTDPEKWECAEVRQKLHQQGSSPQQVVDGTSDALALMALRHAGNTAMIESRIADYETSGNHDVADRLRHELRAYEASVDDTVEGDGARERVRLGIEFPAECGERPRLAAELETGESYAAAIEGAAADEPSEVDEDGDVVPG